MTTYTTTNGVPDLPVDRARKCFTEGLSKHRGMSDEATSVVANSLKYVTARITTGCDSWNEVISIHASFVTPNGELLQQACQHTIDVVRIRDNLEQHSFFLVLYEKALRMFAADEVLIAKLCLLWADEIQKYSTEENGAFGGKSRPFNPEVWSSKILAAYTDKLVLDSLNVK